MKEKIIMDSFAILFDSFQCNRNCPYCISKNDYKFNFKNEESFDILFNIFNDLKNENISFNKIIIIGNGEPTLYAYNVLEKIVNIIIKFKDLFGYIDYYTSGLIFNDNKKFELFNNTINFGIKTEFVICITTFDLELDKKVLKYKNTYFNNNFKSAASIKLSITLTKYLNLDNLFQDIVIFVNKYPNIDKINFKVLRAGKNNKTIQGQWVLTNALSSKVISELRKPITEFFKIEASLKNITLEYGKERQPRRYLIFTKNKLLDFNEKEIEIKKLRQLFNEEKLGVYE